MPSVTINIPSPPTPTPEFPDPVVAVDVEYQIGNNQFVTLVNHPLNTPVQVACPEKTSVYAAYRWVDAAGNRSDPSAAVNAVSPDLPPLAPTDPPQLVFNP